MGLLLQKTLDHHTQIYVWEISEPESFFLDAIPWDVHQRNWLNSLHPKRKMEFLASRYLIHLVTGLLDSHLYKNEFGKLFIKGGGNHISVSHSDRWTGLAVGSSDIGFDLQTYSQKILKIAKRFLHPEELQYLQSIGHFEINWLTSAWAIKEAVYKAYGNKNVLFAEQIRLRMMHLHGDDLRFENARLLLKDYHLNYHLYHDQTTTFSWALAQEH